MEKQMTKKQISRNPSFTPSPSLREYLNTSSMGVTGTLNKMYDDTQRHQSQLNWLVKQSIPSNLLDDEEFWNVLVNAWIGVVIEFEESYTMASDILDHYGEIDINKLPEKARKVAIFCHESTQLEQWSMLSVVKAVLNSRNRHDTGLIELVREVLV